MKHVLIACLAWIAGVAISWGVTVGFMWLICLCFPLQFSLLTATGVWLVMAMVKSFFGTKK